MRPSAALVSPEPRGVAPRRRLRLAPDERAQGAAAHPGAAFAEASELRILVVDDDFLFTDMLPRALQKAILAPRLRIRSARTPEEAWRLLAAEPPDVVLCDHDLHAAQDGVEVLTRIAAAHPDALRVLVSGHARRDIPSLQGAPVDAYVEKPIRLLDIVPPLARLLRERLRMEIQLREP